MFFMQPVCGDYSMTMMNGTLHKPQMQSWTLHCLSLRLVWIWHSVPWPQEPSSSHWCGEETQVTGATSSTQPCPYPHPLRVSQAVPTGAPNPHSMQMGPYQRQSGSYSRAMQRVCFCHLQSLFADNVWNMLSVILINLHAWAMLSTLSNKSRKCK